MKLPPSLTTVTTFSKLLALFLFIIFPSAGFYLGMLYQKSITQSSTYPTATPTPIAPETGGVACTQDAKLCPDGSYVGRQPPSCEFAPCPNQSVKNYCNYSASDPITSFKDCGTFIVLEQNCCDRPDIILDKNGNKLMECGGITGYSKECTQRFLPQNKCKVTSC